MRKSSTATSLGFGLSLDSLSHHFLLNLCDKKCPYIYISEHFEFYENEERRTIEYSIDPNHPSMRVVLPYKKWEAIESSIQFTLNQSLKRAGIKTSKFTVGFNLLPKLLGKEVILLCWAIEDADPALIPMAIKNWQGLKPEDVYNDKRRQRSCHQRQKQGLAESSSIRINRKPGR